MSRVQVLDVGDFVIITRDGWSAQQATVIERAEDGTYSVFAHGSSASGLAVGFKRSELIRCNGDLQPGDWVRATGTVEPFWSCEKEELDAEAGVIVDEIAEGEGDFLVYVLTEADVYECHTDQLTRITRAEALA